MKKKIALSGILVLCICGLIYLTVTTNICGGYNGYERFNREYQLQESELLYGCLSFYKKGIAPVQVEQVSVINKKDIPLDEVKIFFYNRQSMQMTGGPISEADFEESYESNLISVDSLEWLKNEDFQIVVTTKEDKLDGIWVEIKYRVLGIFSKQVYSKELIV